MEDVYGPHFVDLFSGGTLDFDDDNGDDYVAVSPHTFREYLKELKTLGATDAQMLDAYNENLLLLKEIGDGSFHACNESWSHEHHHQSLCFRRYHSTSDDAIGEASGQGYPSLSGRHAMREHIKADRLEAVNQFIVSIRRELSYVRSRVASDVDAFSHASSIGKQIYVARHRCAGRRRLQSQRMVGHR
jgi:hypothetical protein